MTVKSNKSTQTATVQKEPVSNSQLHSHSLIYMPNTNHLFLQTMFLPHCFHYSFYRVLLEQPLQPQEQGGDLINVHKFMKGGCQGDRGRLFSVMSSNSRRGYGQKQIPRKFHLNRMNLFAVWGTTHTGTDCPERLWSFPHWRNSRAIQTKSHAMCSGMTLFE